MYDHRSPAFNASLIKCHWTHGERYILFIQRPNFQVTDSRPILKHYVLKSSFTIIQSMNGSNHGVMNQISTRAINYKTIRKWLESCKRDHASHCESQHLQLPPGFRLIDCQRRRLVDADTLLARPEYLALSYVWGKPSWLAFAQAKEPSDLDHVPRVIEDAISVTIELGFKYLWVDRYCVPQDAHELKMAQINAMDAVYNNAQATIAAAGSGGPSVGLPGISVSRCTQPTARVQGRRFIWSMNQHHDLLSICLWMKRGWSVA